MSKFDLKGWIKVNIEKSIYAVLKEVDAGKRPGASDLGLTSEEFVKVAKIIKQEGYIDNVGIAGTIVFLNNCNLTMRGHKFLEENSAWAKVYQGLKEIRDWIK